MAAAINIAFRIGDIDSVARATRSVIQGAQAAAREQARAALQAAREQKKAADQAARDQIAAAKAAAKEIANAQKASAKEAAAAQKAAAKEAATFQREMDKASAANFRQRVRDQMKAEREAAQAADAAANRRKSALGEVGGGAARGFKRGVGMVAGAAALVGGGVGMHTVADAVQSQMALGERSALLQNASGKNLDFVKMSKGISSAVGVDAGEVMGGLEQLSGKAGGAGIEAIKDNFLELAKVARGAGVNMTDLGNVLGTLVNRGVQSKDLVSTVESLVQQGKDGAVEFKDLATMLDASSGALGRFKMSEGGRITSAGGLSQMARTFGKKSAEEATNAVEDLARDLGGKADIIQQLTGGQKTSVTTKGKTVKKMVDGKLVTTTEGGGTKTTYAGGVEVGTDASRAQLRDINELLPQIIMGAIKNNNAGKIMGEGGIFTGNSTSIVAPLIQAATLGITKNAEGRYGITGAGQKAELTGEAAVKAMLDQFAAANVEAGSSAKAFANLMNTESGKFSVATNRLKNELGDNLAPVITKITPQLIQMGDAFGKAVGYIAENPKKAAAGLIALSTAAGAAEAAVSVGVSKLGEKILDKIVGKTVPVMNVTAGSVTVGGAPGGGGGGGGGFGSTPVSKATGLQKAEAIGAGLTIGVGLGMATADSIDTDLGKRERMAGNASNLAAKIRNGSATAAEREQAQKLLAEGNEKQSQGAFGRFISNATAGYRGLANGDISAGNLASAIPGVAVARGLVGGALEGQAQDVDKNLPAALKELQAALDKPTKLDPGTTLNVVVTNAAEIAASAGSRDKRSAPIAGQ